jgi:hypothetical protein
MVAELALGVWNGGKFVHSMCGHGYYFCYKHAYKVDFVVTCEIAQTKVQTHTQTCLFEKNWTPTLKSCTHINIPQTNVYEHPTQHLHNLQFLPTSTCHIKIIHPNLYFWKKNTNSSKEEPTFTRFKWQLQEKMHDPKP